MAPITTAAAILLLAVIVPSLCQIHLGPEGAMQGAPKCYHCDDHGHLFPNCLDQIHDCHHDEVCSFTYGHGRPSLGCQKAHDCEKETAHPMRNCTGGGVEVHLNECKKCCANDQCTDDLAELLKLEFQQSPDLYCPGECRDNDIEHCVTHGHHCREGQFCQVSKEDGWIKGECKDDHEFHHCSEELKRHQCDHHVGHGPAGHHGRGFWDCCDTNDCLTQHFGAYMTTQAPATTAMTTSMTTAMPSNQSLWERLHGNCDDQLQADACKNLAGTNDVCHSRLALSICPKTCGLCDAINSAVCKDIVLNDGCKDLVANEDVCNDKMALFICPNTCNMCDELVNSLITSLVDGNSTATDMPPSLLPPSANPSSFPTFDCNDIKGESCSTLNTLCSASFINVVCPADCAACTPTTQPPTTMPPTTMPPTTMPPTTMPPTTMPPTTMPPTTMPPTTMPPTTMPPTTMPPTTMPPTTMPPTTMPPTTMPPTTMPPTTMPPTTMPPTTMPPTTMPPTTMPPTTMPPTTMPPTTMPPTTMPPTTMPPTTMPPTTMPPTTMPPTTMPPTTMPPTTIPPETMPPTTMQPTTMMADVVTATTGMVINSQPPSTMAPVLTTTQPPMPTMMMSTTIPAGNVTGAPLCADHLNGMACTDLNDVCNSVLALSVCPKYCGLC